MRPNSYKEKEVHYRCGSCKFCRVEQIQSEDWINVCTHPTVPIGKNIYENAVHSYFGVCDFFEPLAKVRKGG